jgi:hypothetical protein
MLVIGADNGVPAGVVLLTITVLWMVLRMVAIVPGD